jgi:hypothetical protein
MSSGPVVSGPVGAGGRGAVQGGWRQLLWFAVAAAGVGFAGYLYVIPYRQLSGVLETRSRELREERSSGQEAAAERDRLKNSVDTYQSSQKAKVDVSAKSRQLVDAMVAQLKPALEELGASVDGATGRLRVGLSPEKAIDKNGIDVSSEGNAVLKILAGAIKKSGGTVRIKARFGTAPAPKQLRSLFGTVGEVSAVRAARVMSVLEGAGLAPERLSIVGEAEGASEAPVLIVAKGGKQGAKAAARRRKAAAAAAAASAAVGDRLDIEVEPG